jgi:hypothetical protein
MVYDTRNYNVLARHLLSGILKKKGNTTFRKLNLFPSSDEGVKETPTLLKELTSSD